MLPGPGVYVSKLGLVDRWADERHSGRWCVSWLLQAAGLTTISWPLPRSVLGVLVDANDQRVVIVNDTLADALAVPVLAHELAHHLLDEIEHCGTNDLSGVERRAWLGAARLTVSREDAALVRSGQITLAQLAEQLQVPSEFAAVGVELINHDMHAEAAPVSAALWHWFDLLLRFRGAPA